MAPSALQARPLETISPSTTRRLPSGRGGTATRRPAQRLLVHGSGEEPAVRGDLAVVEPRAGGCRRDRRGTSSRRSRSRRRRTRRRARGRPRPTRAGRTTRTAAAAARCGRRRWRVEPVQRLARMSTQYRGLLVPGPDRALQLGASVGDDGRLAGSRDGHPPNASDRDRRARKGSGQRYGTRGGTRLARRRCRLAAANAPTRGSGGGVAQAQREQDGEHLGELARPPGPLRAPGSAHPGEVAPADQRIARTLHLRARRHGRRQGRS